MEAVGENHRLDASDFLRNWGTPSPCSDVRAVLRKGAFFHASSWQHVGALGDIGQRASTMRTAHTMRERSAAVIMLHQGDNNDSIRV